MTKYLSSANDIFVLQLDNIFVTSSVVKRSLYDYYTVEISPLRFASVKNDIILNSGERTTRT